MNYPYWIANYWRNNSDAIIYWTDAEGNYFSELNDTKHTCNSCHGEKQKWNSASRMMENCSECNGKGTI